MPRRIQSTPSGAVIAHGETPLRYIALQHLKIGDRTVEPGEELTPSQLAGRDLGSMLRHSQIQQVIKPGARRRPRKAAAK